MLIPINNLFKILYSISPFPLGEFSCSREVKLKICRKMLKRFLHMYGRNKVMEKIQHRIPCFMQLLLVIKPNLTRECTTYYLIYKIHQN